MDEFFSSPFEEALQVNVNLIFSLGSNGSGQLGLGHQDDCSTPQYIHPPHGLSNTEVAQIAAGGNHTLLLTEIGEVYWSGDPCSGACGIATESANGCFKKIRFTENGNDSVGKVAFVTATWDASVIVAKDENGRATRVFTFGTGQKGELGLGQSVFRTAAATQIKEFPPEGKEIVDIAACMGHVVAVLDNGEAWGWGNGRKGQVGGPGQFVYSPQMIAGVDFTITRAACGREFTCLFGKPETGKLHILGADKYGVKTNAPVTLPKWQDIGASWGSIYVLEFDGKVLCWGRDDHGQLAPPQHPKISKMAIGSEHVVALTTVGEVVSWGWGEHGNCGPNVEGTDVKGTWNPIVSPKSLPARFKVKAVGAGCATSWVMLEQRSLPSPSVGE